mmetsp:Transcript_993/g.3120  ORF Transcript_993/g.3120 Transcript_993/m.3120 type:complete len:294 (-) Transcript_993:17-898(-)
MACAQPLPTSPKPKMTAFLPAIITSVARMMPSGSEWRQPYTLSNLDLVTASFTLIAGNRSLPWSAICWRRCTPVVVSSDTPTMLAVILWKKVGSRSMLALMMESTHLNSALSVEAGSGSAPFLAKASSAAKPSCMRSVTSPPSSTMRSAPDWSGQVMALAVHHQYSSRVSPFQANTLAEPAFTTPAAAWSWVEKMLHEHQRTSAPSLLRVSMSTAVWMVMCSEPTILALAKGCSAPYSVRQAMRPGISTSASSMSLRPKSASDMSATLKSPEASTFLAIVLRVSEILGSQREG